MPIKHYLFQSVTKAIRPSDEQNKADDQKKQEQPSNSVQDPNKKPDDNATGPADRFWSPTSFETPNKQKAAELDCSPEALAAATVVANGEVDKRLLGQAKLFICDVKDRMDNHPEEPAPTHQSLLVLSTIVGNMIPVMADMSLDSMGNYFNWLIAELQRLQSTKDIPGQVELGNLITYLQKARTVKNPIVLYNVANSRYKATSELRNTFCPWKNAIDGAAPGSTRQFPIAILYCPAK